ncbi:MAG: glucosaminidase domain-containing protein [Porphyromonas sp.]|nr:glucosaminidase domain-containing protein [Porphyromonas sp.]
MYYRGQIYKALVGALLSCVALVAQVPKRYPAFEDYVRKHYREAIRQMDRHGIPASITMAQGLLETGGGKSSLAVDFNNHFGIKCHAGWTGRKAYKTDDAPDECFRGYKSWQESYEDHSLFLKKPRYAKLFMLRTDDYKGWASGLQRAGYATNKGYANKLIQIIEAYELYALDRSSEPLWMRSGEGRNASNRTSKSSIGLEAKDKPLRPVYKSYGLLYVLADPNDTLERIARETGISLRKLAHYNDAPEDLGLQEGEVVYLERKHRSAKDPYKTHRVAIGDSMHSISQRYGIRLESLYELNNKDEDYVPEEGDVLRLR